MSSVLTKINGIFRNLCPRRVMSPQEVYKLEDDHERRSPLFEHKKLLGDFTNESFPDGEEYQGLTEAVRGMTDIIVLINLLAIGPNRNANRSSEMKENCMRTGTGIVSGVTKYISGNRKCSCPKCRDSDEPSKVCGKIHITTKIGLVFDGVEGKHASFRFCYKKNVNTIPFTGCTKVKPDPENGTCELTFATCDTDLLDALEVTLKMLQGLSNKRKDLVNLSGLSSVFAHNADLTQRINVCDNAPKWLSFKFNRTELVPIQSLEDTALKQENVSMNLHVSVSLSIGHGSDYYGRDITHLNAIHAECPEKATIRMNYIFLVSALRHSHLVPYLFQENVLSVEDKYDIEDEQKRLRKIEMILDKVMRGCPEAFLIFLKALEENYQHVADRLRQVHLSLTEK